MDNRGDGFLHNDGMMTLMLSYMANYYKQSLTNEKYFLLSKEKEFTRAYCHSMICMI